MLELLAILAVVGILLGTLGGVALGATIVSRTQRGLSPLPPLTMPKGETGDQVPDTASPPPPDPRFQV